MKKTAIAIMLIATTLTMSCQENTTTSTDNTDTISVQPTTVDTTMNVDSTMMDSLKSNM